MHFQEVISHDSYVDKKSSLHNIPNIKFFVFLMDLCPHMTQNDIPGFVQIEEGVFFIEKYDAAVKSQMI